MSTVATVAPPPAPARDDCAEIAFRTTASTYYEFLVALPALGARSVRELELTLERDMALGRTIDMVTIDGLEFRLQPDFVEELGVFDCR